MYFENIIFIFLLLAFIFAVITINGTSDISRDHPNRYVRQGIENETIRLGSLIHHITPSDFHRLVCHSSTTCLADLNCECVDFASVALIVTMVKVHFENVYDDVQFS